jgi:hypothetical protein
MDVTIKKATMYEHTNYGIRRSWKLTTRDLVMMEVKKG